MKNNVAITLIALIITIIVLLILAGVTLNMVMGENGIFGKANNAKNKTEVAQYEEELRLCVLELQTDAATNGTTFNMDTIKNKFVEKVKELENTTDIEFPTGESETRLDGTYKGYEFYIDDKYVAHIGDKSTGISLTTSLEPTGWTQGPVTATITIKSNNGLKKIVPQGENEITLNGEKEYTITKSDIAENTIFTYEVTDSQNNTQTKTAIINTIDKEPPADFTITAENTAEGLKITGETTDAESGVDHYEYFVKDESNKETKYDTNLIQGLATGKYTIYVIVYDKAGNNIKSNIVNMNIKEKLGKVKEISAGQNHSLAIDMNGKIWTWGSNYRGILGIDNSSEITCLEPERINTETKFKKISAGYRYSLAIDINGNIWGWGDETDGKVGSNKYGNTVLLKPTQITNGTKFNKVVAGKSSSFAIDEDGNIWSWGAQSYGRLGNGKTGTSFVTIPEKRNFESKFIEVASTEYGGYGLDINGDIWYWGDGQNGLSGTGINITYSNPVKLEVETKFKHITIGQGKLAIDINGNIWSWGTGSKGQLGTGNINEVRIPQKITNGITYESIENGNCNSFAFDNEKELWKWGNYTTGFEENEEDILVPEKAKYNVKFSKISSSKWNYFILGIDEENNLYTWEKIMMGN